MIVLDIPIQETLNYKVIQWSNRVAYAVF